MSCQRETNNRTEHGVREMEETKEEMPTCELLLLEESWGVTASLGREWARRHILGFEIVYYIKGELVAIVNQETISSAMSL